MSLNFGALWRSTLLQAVLILAAIAVAFAADLPAIRVVAWLAAGEWLLFGLVTLLLGRLPGDTPATEPSRSTKGQVRAGGIIALLFSGWTVAWLLDLTLVP